MFDFDATLPLMAVQFLILMALLNALFYKPLNKAIDDRAEYINTNEAQAKERLAKAENLAKEYELQLTSARKQSQEIISSAQAEAKIISDTQIAQAVKEAQAKKEAAALEIEKDRQQALAQLEQQVETLGRQILEKLLGPELIR